MRETGYLPSVLVQSEKEVVPLINTRENILEMVQRRPRMPTRIIASRIGVSHMQVWRNLHEDIYILIMTTGYNIWNQRTMPNVWIFATV